jgi:ABC-type transport system substrate-binding protein
LPIEHNQEKAKGLLDASGVFENGRDRYFEGEPVQLKLIYNSGRVYQGSPEELVILDLIGNLKKIGIKVQPKNFPAKAFEDKLASGDYDMAFQKYEVGFGSNIAPLFTEGDKQNISRFTDPMLTNYLENFNSTKGKQKRQYGKQIHKIVYKEAPYIFLYRLDKIMAYRKELETKDNIVPKYFFTHIGEWYFKDYK